MLTITDDAADIVLVSGAAFVFLSTSAADRLDHRTLLADPSPDRPRFFLDR